MLSGIRVLSDSMIEICVTGDSFPYFYGVALFNAKPYRIAVITPGCEVADDGQGAYIRNQDPEIEEPIFTAELLSKTLLDPETGYEYHPMVTSGAYRLESYDKEANEAHFVVNEYYVGNFEGQNPHIERLVFKHMTEESMLSDLVEGKAGLLNKVTDSLALQKVQELTVQWNAQATENGEASVSIEQASYIRTGFGFLAFACEDAPMDEVAVRRAIAMSFDKDAFVEEAMPGTAMRSYGYYGLGQWMPNYYDEGDETQGIESMEITSVLPDLDVPTDLQQAQALLESAGWTLNGNGERYESGRDPVRYRDRDGVLEPLTIRCAVTENNQVAQKMRETLEAALPMLGINLEVTAMPFPQLLSHYYRQAERTYDMFFMASNFSYIFDPYYDFNINDIYQGVVNALGLKDEGLMALSNDMRQTEPTDLRGYVEKWMGFQERFVELMPMVPLYSNIYYDFHTDALGNYDITANAAWAYAITYAYVRDQAQPVEMR